MLNRQPQMLGTDLGGYLFGATFEPLKAPSSPDKTKKSSLATCAKLIDPRAYAHSTFPYISASKLPETPPPGLGLAALGITLRCGKKADFIISARNLQTQTRRRIADVVNQACRPLFHLAPQERNITQVSSSLLISEERSVDSSWRPGLRPSLDNAIPHAASRSSAAWKALFGPRCPSRDTRAQTGGDTTSSRRTTSAGRGGPTSGVPGHRVAVRRSSPPIISSCPAVSTLRLNRQYPASRSVSFLTPRLANPRRESARCLCQNEERFPGVVWDY